jgi:putative transposase
MPNYRRARNAGATYFFTVVTAGRRPLLVGEQAIAALRQSVTEVHRQMPFSIDAWVVLPDHMHALWTLPESDADFSSRWGRIKAGFTRLSGLAHRSGPQQDSGLWQPRFWEHLIRDAADFAAHMDYLHYNPVKHGHAARVVEWRHSSFHRCVLQGIYPAGWGDSEPATSPDRSFGE